MFDQRRIPNIDGKLNVRGFHAERAVITLFTQFTLISFLETSCLDIMTLKELSTFTFKDFYNLEREPLRFCKCA